MPMRVIGMLLGIPEPDQVAVRNKTDATLRTDAGQADEGQARERSPTATMFADYIDWRAEHPSDDLMTQLLNAEFEDETGDDPDAHRDRRCSPTRRSSPAPATRPPAG